MNSAPKLSNGSRKSGPFFEAGYKLFIFESMRLYVHQEVPLHSSTARKYDRYSPNIRARKHVLCDSGNLATAKLTENFFKILTLVLKQPFTRYSSIFIPNVVGLTFLENSSFSEIINEIKCVTLNRVDLSFPQASFSILTKFRYQSRTSMFDASPKSLV